MAGATRSGHRRLHRRVAAVQRRDNSCRDGHLPDPGRALGGRPGRAPPAGRRSSPSRRTRPRSPASSSTSMPGSATSRPARRHSSATSARRRRTSDLLEIEARLTDTRGQIERSTAQQASLRTRPRCDADGHLRRPRRRRHQTAAEAGTRRPRSTRPAATLSASARRSPAPGSVRDRLAADPRRAGDRRLRRARDRLAGGWRRPDGIAADRSAAARRRRPRSAAEA